MHACFVTVDGIDYLSSVCFISSFQAIQVSRNLRFQNYQNLGDRYVLLIAYRFVLHMLLLSQTYCSTHFLFMMKNTVGLIFLKELLIIKNATALLGALMILFVWAYFHPDV